MGWTINIYWPPPIKYDSKSQSASVKTGDGLLLRHEMENLWQIFDISRFYDRIKKWATQRIKGTVASRLDLTKEAPLGFNSLINSLVEKAASALRHCDRMSMKNKELTAN